MKSEPPAVFECLHGGVTPCFCTVLYIIAVTLAKGAKKKCRG